MAAAAEAEAAVVIMEAMSNMIPAAIQLIIHAADITEAITHAVADITAGIIPAEADTMEEDIIPAAAEAITMKNNILSIIITPMTTILKKRRLLPTSTNRLLPKAMLTNVLS
jgi:hypothetical protein